jgi:hypothetical protein
VDFSSFAISSLGQCRFDQRVPRHSSPQQERKRGSGFELRREHDGQNTMVRESSAEPAPYPANKARGGEVILKSPARRAIFLAGLIGAVVLVLVLAFAR